MVQHHCRQKNGRGLTGSRIAWILAIAAVLVLGVVSIPFYGGSLYGAVVRRRR